MEQFTQKFLIFLLRLFAFYRAIRGTLTFTHFSIPYLMSSLIVYDFEKILSSIWTELYQWISISLVICKQFRFSGSCMGQSSEIASDSQFGSFMKQTIIDLMVYDRCLPHSVIPNKIKHFGCNLLNELETFSEFIWNIWGKEMPKREL